MWIRQGEDGREWVVTPQRVNGKTLAARVPLEEFNREQEASRMAKEKRAVDKKAEEERQAAEAEQKRRADRRGWRQRHRRQR